MLCFTGEGAGMSAKQRISRGFHRLAVFLAAIPLLIGIGFCLIGPPHEMTNYDLIRHQKLVCAHDHIASLPATAQKGLLSDEEAGFP